MVSYFEINNTSYVFTKFNVVCAYPNIAEKNIKKIDAWSNCLFVTFYKGSPRFLSKKKVLAVFAANRESRATEINLNNIGYNKYKKVYCYKEYEITVNTCTCMDYKLQLTSKINNPACKHIYAIRNLSAMEKRILQLSK